MAFGNGPRVVTDGLVLALDAADRNSYPGSGTTWNNIAGANYAGGFVNGTSYTSSVNQGVISTNTTSSYITIAGNTANNDNAWTTDGSVGSTTLCYEIWIKTSDSSGFILSKPWNGGGQYNQLLTTGGWSVMVGANLSNGINFANTINNNVWRQVVVWATSTQIGYYLDGGIYSGSQNHGLTGGAGSSGNATLTLMLMSLYPYGEGWVGDPSFTILGNVAIFRKYSSVLTSQQVNNNYNAQKSRFGL
jgi:hypothetical protein